MGSYEVSAAGSQQLYIGLPDAAGRAAILQTCVRHIPMVDSIDVAAIATACEGFSGADLAALVREAALIAIGATPEGAARGDLRLTAAHFDAAVKKMTQRARIIARPG